ncbi:MAG: hypothetical protein RMM17_12230 [Acidobacteriota bacterium]|nr:hypothetical protein [Blastocatellia bacterium]MDW8413437.1 hypothetical protein [Acidobacteriota bacterium]
MSTDDNLAIEKKQKTGFLRKAIDKTRAAIKNVDEAITFRETFKSIDERFDRQASFNQQISSALEELKLSAKQQQLFFDNSIKEVKAAEQSCKDLAKEASDLLSKAKEVHYSLQKSTNEQLMVWQQDLEMLRKELKLLKEQTAALQESFKHFVISALVIFSLFALVIVYLLYQN